MTRFIFCLLPLFCLPCASCALVSGLDELDVIEQADSLGGRGPTSVSDTGGSAGETGSGGAATGGGGNTTPAGGAGSNPGEGMGGATPQCADDWADDWESDDECRSTCGDIADGTAVACGALLDCFAIYNCTPESCSAHADDLCGVNAVHGASNSGLQMAESVYHCRCPL